MQSYQLHVRDLAIIVSTPFLAYMFSIFHVVWGWQGWRLQKGEHKPDHGRLHELASALQ